MEISNAEVFNFDGAFRGLRNPMNSWDRSDSTFQYGLNGPEFILGEKDKDLAQRMIRAGDSDAKFLRQIFVSVDIDAPLLWWKEMDQYRISTTTNSCSTMHKISSTPITADCFEFSEDNIYTSRIVDLCENLRQKYNETHDIKYWRALIEILPSAWLQKRTWTGNYANLRNIYFQRKNHKLQEWHIFCDWIQSLPYAEDLLTF